MADEIEEQTSLMGETPPPEAAEETAEAPQEEAQEWFKSDKYKTVEDQAKAYTELEKKLGSFTGAPDDYDITYPEGFEGDLEAAKLDPRVMAIAEAAKAQGMNQEGFTQLMHALMASEADQSSVSMENELALLGDNGKDRINAVEKYLGANLDEEMYAEAVNVAKTAAGLQLLEKLMQNTKDMGRIPSETPNAPPAVSGDALRSSVDWDKYNSDPAYRAQIAGNYSNAYGDAPKKEVMG